MDRSLKSRPSRHSSSSKKHRKHRHEKVPKAPSVPDEKDLNEVVEEEVKPRVNKAQPVPPPVVSEPVAAPVQEAPVVTEQAAEEQDEDVDEDEVSEPGDTVRASEVLETVDDSQKKKKNKRSGGGDYGAAYNELYTQLYLRMVNRIYRYFKGLYSKTRGKEEKFKKKLEAIQVWNQNEIDKRASEILQVYPDTEAYFKYAYAANVMLMSVVVQRDEESEDVEIEVPKFSEFIQKSYVESARAIYDNAGVLSPDLTDYEKMRIREELYACFGKAIATALRMMVPLDLIAPQSIDTKGRELGFDDDDDQSVDESESDGSESEEEESDLESESEEEDDDEESGSSEEESESEFDSESEEEEEDPRRRKVRVSRKSLNTPDKLNIDQYE